MRLKVVAFTSVLIVLLPMHFGATRLLNELIISISAVLAIVFFALTRHLSRFEVCAITIGLSVSLSFLTSLWLSSGPFITKDYVEPFLPALYAAIFCMGFVVSQKYDPEAFTKTFFVFAVVSIAFSTLVFLPITFPLVDLYKGRQSVSSLEMHFPRFSGSFGYPGPFSYWLVLFIGLLFTREARHYLKTWQALVLVTLGGSALALTGSRGGAIIFSLAVLVWATKYLWFKARVKTALQVSLLLVVISAVGIVIFASGASVRQLSYLVSGLQDIAASSAGHRLGELSWLVAELENATIFGFGPSNRLIQGVLGPVETAYFYYGFKFGLMGLLSYLGLCLFVLYLLIKTVRETELSFSFVVLSWAFICLTIGAMNEVISIEYKSFFFFYLILGYTTAIVFYRPGAKCNTCAYRQKSVLES